LDPATAAAAVAALRDAGRATLIVTA